ncbi:MAG: hypothetical protein K6C40_04120 [Thermoguttaceae bacterium]|nr:hypothetical protein [Thermoguttaceae bacterium]
MRFLKLWPGLDYLVRHGSFRAWLGAMFYAFFAMVVLCVTLVWDDMMPLKSQKVLLVLFAFSWLLGIFVSHQFEKAFQESQKQRSKDSTANDILPLAQTEFLRQNFYEAEKLLRERLLKFPEDVPARFLLVSVLRHQKRVNDAREQLAILEQNPALGLWGLELFQEKEILRGDSD